MITGDNPLTACHVAKELKITTRPVMILQCGGGGEGGDDGWTWESVKGDASVRFDPSKESISNVTRTNELCVTGQVRIL